MVSSAAARFLPEIGRVISERDWIGASVRTGHVRGTTVSDWGGQVRGWAVGDVEYVLGRCVVDMRVGLRVLNNVHAVWTMEQYRSSERNVTHHLVTALAVSEEMAWIDQKNSMVKLQDSLATSRPLSRVKSEIFSQQMQHVHTHETDLQTIMGACPSDLEIKGDHVHSHPTLSGC